MTEAPTKTTLWHVPRTKLTDEQAAIVAEYWPLARRLAKRFAANHSTLKIDFRSAAGDGLCKAAETYDPSRGTKFVTHAYKKIQYAMLDAIRASIRQQPIFQSDIIPFIASHDEPIGWEARSQDTIEALTSRLEWLPREVIILTYLYGFTQDKTARVLNLSATWVLEIHKAALMAMRRAVNPETHGRRVAS